jgi:hypothetical protein
MYEFVLFVCVYLCVINTSLSSVTVLRHPCGVPRTVYESPMGC